MPRPISRMRSHRILSYGSALPVLGALVGIAVFLLRERAIAGLWGFSLDDSWIHAVFARNISTGSGYGFNPGESVSGSTGPFYSLLLAFAYSITGQMVWSGKLIGIISHVAAVILMYRAGSHLKEKIEWLPAMAATMVAVSPPLLWASVSGMEISLYLMLVCWGLERYLAGKDVTATLLWSLGVWVRPDGVFLVALGMLGPTRTLWKRAAMAAAVILPFFAFNAILGGTIFPQTVGAKAHLGIDLRGRTWILFREWAAMWGIPFRVDDQLEHPILLLPFLIAGAVLLARRYPVLGLYAIGLPLVLSLFRENSGSHKRYIIYVIPFGILLALEGVRWMAERAARRRAAAALLAVSLTCLIWQAGIAANKATTHGWNVQNINMMQRELGLTINQETAPDVVVAASDIGAIGYFSGRKVVDLMGLVSKQRSLPENLSRHKPDVLALMVDWFAAYARPDTASRLIVSVDRSKAYMSPASVSHFCAFYDVDSTHKYTAIAVFELKHNTICASDQMIAFVRQTPGDKLPPLYYRRL